MEGLNRYDYFDKRFSTKIQFAHEIIESKDFHIALNLERLRSDRNEQEFSLILFEINKDDNPKMITEFISIIHKRMRALDVAGWFDKNHLGIILPFCDMEGTCKFTVEVEKGISDNFVSPPYTIFIYPDHWIDNDKNKTGEQQLNKEYSDTSNVINIENREPFSSISQGYEKKLKAIKNKIQSVFTKATPVWKRVIDIVLSSIALLLLSPLFLLVAVCIKIMSPGPVFFKQIRVGYRGKQFTMFKFRTMKVNNNDTVHKEYAKQFIKSDQKLVKLDNKDDNRIIPCGKLLRNACIDELPQLFNVLRGEMSIVGPRPPIPYEAEEYNNWHISRFNVVPGLTGLWQVSGKQKLTFNQMVRLDIRYSKKLSLMFDLFIMFKTIPTIFGMIFEAVIRKFTKIKEYTDIHDMKTMKKGSLYLMIFELFFKLSNRD